MARTAPTLVAVLVVLAIALGALPAGVTVAAKQIIDGVLTALDTQAATDKAAVYRWIVIVASLTTAILVAKQVMTLLRIRVTAGLARSVGIRTLDKAARLSLPQLEDPKVQQLLTVVRRDGTKRPFNLLNRSLLVVQAVVQVGAFATLLWGFHPAAVALVVLAALPSMVVDARFSTEVYTESNERLIELKERGYLESVLTAESFAKERLHYRSGRPFRQAYAALFDRHFGRDRSLQIRTALASIGISLLGAAVYVGVYVWIVGATLDGGPTIGEMTMYLAAFRQSQAGLGNVAKTLGGARGDVMAVSRLWRFFDLPERRDRGDATTGPDPNAGIEIDAVRFTYPNAKRPALDAVSLTARPGEMVAIVGMNGSGKTTLMKVLLGLYAPDDGEVRVDGRPLAEWDPIAWRRRVGVIFQGYTKYKLSLGTNIGVGAGPDALEDDALLERAASLGMVDTFIGDLDGGFDQRLGKQFPGGRDLSGGQWQRIALARAYANPDADILILDEPTSSMDPAAEARLFDRVRENATHAITLLISHRLANVRHADRIVVMDRGRVVEQGTHDELMARDGVYGRLFRRQAEHYTTD